MGVVQELPYFVGNSVRASGGTVFGDVEGLAELVDCDWGV